ncbi:MAG: RNA methyltransferase [Bacteroidota bacterium]|nr:RNA methyltransferase [Bacteroidota bacterium]
MLFREPITSVRNPRIKNFQHLQKARERREQNLFIIEGLKELSVAVNQHYHFESLFFYPELISEDQLGKQVKGINTDVEVFPVSRDVYEKIAYRENSGGIVALARPRQHQLEDIPLSNVPLLLVLESVEKPGNLGALLRTADAAGLDGVIVCDPQTDLYNPNVVRSSIGCLFSVPVAICNSSEAIEWMRTKGITIYCTYLQAAVPYHTVDFKRPSAIVMGTEADGITPLWVKAADQNIIIPMRGDADSMNVSTSAAVVVFEACRQRDFKF